MLVDGLGIDVKRRRQVTSRVQKPWAQSSAMVVFQHICCDCVTVINVWGGTEGEEEDNKLIQNIHRNDHFNLGITIQNLLFV